MSTVAKNILESVIGKVKRKDKSYSLTFFTWRKSLWRSLVRVYGSFQNETGTTSPKAHLHKELLMDCAGIYILVCVLPCEIMIYPLADLRLAPPSSGKSWIRHWYLKMCQAKSPTVQLFEMRSSGKINILRVLYHLPKCLSGKNNGDYSLETTFV